MQHDNHAEQLAVGCICAEKMSGDYFTSRRLERNLKNRSIRRERWLSLGWRPVCAGDGYRLRRDGRVYLVKQRGPNWLALVFEEPDGWRGGRRSFPSCDSAMLAMFDYYWPAREPGPQVPRARPAPALAGRGEGSRPRSYAAKVPCS